jgi:hypothetical protein
MSPTVDNPTADTDALTASAWTNGSTHETQTARARLRFIGDVVELRADFSTHLRRNAEFFVDAPGPNGEPPDTVPAYSVLKQVRWRVDGANGPKFVVDNDPQFDLDSPSDGIPPDGRVPPGLHIGRLRAPDQAGGGTATFFFQSNFSPESWWAGPDPSRFPPSSDGDGRAVDVLDWAHFTTSPAWPPDGRGYFAPDSLQFLPHTRRPVNDDFDRRTFYEIWGNRIYARSEGDVVHQGAWVVFATGGFDRDSPYMLHVSPNAPTLPLGWQSQPDRYPVLFEQGVVGSPVGFRQQVPVRLPSGVLTQPSESITHPIYDVGSVFYDPTVASYWRMELPGKAYAMVPAVDGYGQVGRTNEDLIAVADRVDAGLGSAEDQVLRRRVLTFLVQPASAVSGAAPGAAGVGMRRVEWPR